MGSCQISEQILGRSLRGLRLENDLLATTVLLDKGADIYELIYKPKGMDVLWKSPWGIKETARGFDSAFDSVTAWLEAYAGGWQVLFPSGGGPCVYKGAALNFHGEASMVAWNYEVVEQSDRAAEVRLMTRLFRSPFRLERRMRVEAGKPVLIIREKITSEAGEEMDYMWSHHPAFGAPFLSDQCRVDIGSSRILADDGYAGTHNPMTVNVDYDWPMANGADLSAVPGQETPRDILGYFHDFESGWYGITNTEHGFGVGLVWDKDIFPYAWYWQEMHASAGFPWYKGVYVMAIEPASSIPGQGLVAVMDKTQTHRTLAPGRSVEIEMRAVFYESATGVQKINPDGSVVLK
ncbi:MAG: aldose 1-epimerase [Anaerolineae bacterium]|nr:aldose 1-epimerase [Anaerolineae bacterium]